VNTYSIFFFQEAEEFIGSLSEKDRAKVFAVIKILGTNFSAVYTKPLKGPIKELIVRQYRLLFFIKDTIIYITSGFTKKTKKTPKREIERVEILYKTIQNQK
jgi:phage-related protein